MTRRKVRILSGVQPSGELHLGNYFGMIKRMVEYQTSGELFCFIPNLHAMTSLSDGAKLRENTLSAAVALLSLGIDPEKSVLWVQSDVPEVLELYWILSNFTPMGLLERAHSYKDKTAKGIAANHGLFSYPVLMAADILLFGAEMVPVGRDQIQHVEIARDIAIKFNNEYGEILKLPQAKVDEDVAVVPGLDGAKMSKSYGNTIDIFCDDKTLQKTVNRIVTDSTPVEEPKNPDTCNLFALTKLFLNNEQQGALKARYRQGGEGYGQYKKELFLLIKEQFAPYNEKRAYYLEHKDDVLDILNNGAKKAKTAAAPYIEKIRHATGLEFRRLK